MVKAIETVYSGYRFRSRLEARYAVFFDTLGIPWEYEKEGYDLNGIWYLPDFWLPQQERWIEIKGKPPTKEEYQKADQLYLSTGYPVCLFHGLPDEYYGEAFYSCAHNSHGGSSSSDNVEWKQCFTCMAIDVNIRCWEDCTLINEVEDWRSLNSCNCFPYSRVQGTITSQLLKAYTAARQARFERGR